MSVSSANVPERFAGLSYYDVFSLPPTCSAADLKAKYRQLALKFHPDHNRAEHANEEFAFIAHIHETLSDPEKRRFYDETGSSDGLDLSVSAVDYWRSIFPAVTEADIEQYKKNYIESKAEIEDIKAAYQTHDGDLASIIESVPFADAASVTRLVAILKKECRASYTKAEVNKFIKELKESESSEAVEAEQALEELRPAERAKLKNSSGSGEDALKSIIQARQAGRAQALNGFFVNFEKKYAKLEEEERKAKSSKGKAGKNKNKGKSLDDSATEESDDDEEAGEEENSSESPEQGKIDEEEFQAIQNKMKQNKQNNAKKRQKI